MRKCERGFSLIEMIGVLAIIGILSSLVTVYFHRYMLKAKVEQQVNHMYADLMDARAEAIMQKDNRTVRVATDGTTTSFTVRNGAGAVIRQLSYQYPVAPIADADKDVTFDTLGLASGNGVPMTLCISPVGATPGTVDGLQIDTSLIQIGKLSGGTCNSASINFK